jgi:hypothetical protein
MGSRSRDRGGGECWGPGGRTFVTPLRYTNCSSACPTPPPGQSNQDRCTIPRTAHFAARLRVHMSP